MSLLRLAGMAETFLWALIEDLRTSLKEHPLPLDIVQGPEVALGRSV